MHAVQSVKSNLLRSRLVPGAFAVVLLTAIPCAWGESPKSNAAALAHLFGEDSQSNVIELREQTVRRTVAERYALLRGHVLPAGRNEIVVAIDFAPACPASSTIARFGLLEDSHLLPLDETDLGIKSPRTLLAPAIDLVEAARELDRLAELQQEVLARSAELPEQRKSQLAVLALIDIAAGRFDDASESILKLLEIANQQPPDRAERPAEAVVIWVGTRFPQTLETTRDLLFLVYEQGRVGNAPRSERWHRHICSQKYLFDWRSSSKQNDLPNSMPRRNLTYWQPVSRQTAETRGHGYPVARWETRPGRVQHVTNHDHDYLYYAIPLTGDFTVEALLSTFNYHEIQLAVDNYWAGPGYDLKHCWNGDFRENQIDAPIVPPLTRMHDEMHARVVVRDGMRTTFIDGRKVFETPHTQQSEPWIGVHCPWFTKGFARDLRILGSPMIPREIFLAQTPDLAGWISYFDEPVGQDDSDWRLVVESGEPVLIGRVDPELQGSAQESLLRYHRPMLEDGTLEYDFFYEEGRCDVHPALGRGAFILQPAGVGIHEITDGRFDRMGSDPANFTRVLNSLGDAIQLPLRSENWNHLQLDLQGDRVTLTLNGDQILSHELDTLGDRTFGLFHYADRTEARVRNLRWRGDWPKELPALPEQELVDVTVDNLIEDAQKLPSVLEHDFSNGFPVEQFLISGENWEQHIEQLDDGIRMTRPGGNYARDTFSLPLSLEGDFDIVLEFAGFHSSVVEKGEANLQLVIYFDDLESTECRIYRKCRGFANGKVEQIIESGYFHQKQGNLEMLFPTSPAEATESGRMRFLRRGDQLYYLFATSDSPTFRLLHRQTIPAGATTFAGVKGVVESHKDGFASAVWKRISVQAEAAPGRFSGPPLSIAELNLQRDKLVATRFDRFTDKVQLDQFNVWTNPANIKREPEGWIVSQPGYDQWRAEGITSRYAVVGDFDLSFEFDAIEFEAAAKNSESAILLHVGFASTPMRNIELKFTVSPNDIREVAMQLNTRHRNGSMRYEELRRVKAENVTQLRVARRGTIAYLIYQTESSAEPTILGRIEVGTDNIPAGSVWAIVHTGGAGRNTIVRYRVLNIAADKLLGAAPPN